MKTSEVLDKAADLIEERGWAQGPGGWGIGLDSRLCLEGGILAASGSDFEHTDHSEFRTCPAFLAVKTHLALPSYLDLWDWNDERHRTASEVIEVLRASAVIEAAREERDAAWATYAELVTS